MKPKYRVIDERGNRSRMYGPFKSHVSAAKNASDTAGNYDTGGAVVIEKRTRRGWVFWDCIYVPEVY